MKGPGLHDVVSLSGPDWQVANRVRLDLHLERLRLRIERRVLWLRTQWMHDPLQMPGSHVVSDAQADSHLRHEDADEEARFHDDNPASRALAERLSALDRTLGERRPGEPAPAVDALAQLFRLSSFERDVLLLCLAPELDAGFELLYAYAQDDAARRHATPALALAVLTDGAEDRSLARAAFAPGRPLRTFCLVRMRAQGTASLFSQAMHLDERLVHYLTGVGNRADAALDSALTEIDETPLGSRHHEQVERLAALAADGSLTTVNLLGSPGCGRHAVAAGLVRRLGMTLIEVDPNAVPAAGQELSDWADLLAREAILLNLAFFIEADRVDSQDRARVLALRQLVESLRAFVVIGSRERYASRRELLAVPLEPLDASTRRWLWRQTTGASDRALDALAQQFEIGPHAIAQVVADARALARLEGAGEAQASETALLWRACRERSARPLQDLGRRIESNVGWDDLVLPADSTAQMREIAAQVEHRGRVYEEWGFGPMLSRGRGISALFSGPSGTGKTMAAEVLARHLNLDLFRIDLSGVVSKYIGETEKNLRRVFDAAEASGAILFFDEADALFGKRSEVKDSHDRYANIEVDYLLQRMEDYRGLAILATNMKSQLDPAFLRRLRFIVEFPFPDADIRRRIWERAFPTATPVGVLDLDALGRLEIAGGSIRNIALGAAFLAAAEGSRVEMSHLRHAARREYQKLEKTLPADEVGGQTRRRP